MPKKAVELSAVEVKRLTHPGHTYNAIFAVGGVGGLLLQITPNGAKTWLLRYSLNGRRRHMGLGGYPDVTLAQARERAREARESIWRGEDPVEARRAQRAQADAERLRTLTFADAMERYLEVKLSEFGNAKHRKQWRSTLDTYAIPAIGQMAVGDIDVHDVQRAVAPIWHSKTETASRLRGRIESVLAWATVNGHRTGDNPARWRGNLDAVLPKPSRINSATHHPALALSDASAWFSDLLRRNGTAARALEYMALTAARSGEVRGAQWDEIDFQTAIWTVPADRMKAHREHRVPLTEQALDVLRRLPRQLHSPLLFPAPRGGMLSDMALSACMRRIHAARPGVVCRQPDQATRRSTRVAIHLPRLGC